VADISTGRILTLIFATVLIIASLGLAFQLVTRTSQASKDVGGTDLMVKFMDDGLIITTTVDIPAEDIKIYLKRKVDGETVEFEQILDAGILKKLDIFRYDYPFNDVELAIVYYYDETLESGPAWVPYFLHNYEFGGGE